MKRKRVVVTGMGVVSCFGNDVHRFYDKLLNGISGVRTIAHFDCQDCPTHFAAYIDDFNSESYIDPRNSRRIDPCIAYALVAGKKALEFANIDPQILSPEQKKRCGVIVGTGIGGMSVYAQGIRTLEAKGAKKISPFFIPYTLTNMPGALLAIDLGFKGPNYSISTACATSNFAILAAVDHIRQNRADIMLCGGSEAPINEVGLAGFSACKALSRRNDSPSSASRPWDKSRDGFVMGEGAGVLVLESLEHAQARGATIYGEILGGGTSCDAHHITEVKEDASGIILCMQNALADAEVEARAIDHVNAHATSTPQGDLVEIRGLHTIIPNPERVSITATKSMIGHSLGAAGALEAIASLLALDQGEIHPTNNLETPEDNIRFFIPKTRHRQEIQVAMSNSFGFGGHNATVIFGRYNR